MSLCKKRTERKAQMPLYFVAIHRSLSFIMMLLLPSPSPESSSAWLCGLNEKLLDICLLFLIYSGHYTDI